MAGSAGSKIVSKVDLGDKHVILYRCRSLERIEARQRAQTKAAAALRRGLLLFPVLSSFNRQCCFASLRRSLQRIEAHQRAQAKASAALRRDLREVLLRERRAVLEGVAALLHGCGVAGLPDRLLTHQVI